MGSPRLAIGLAALALAAASARCVPLTASPYSDGQLDGCSSGYADARRSDYMLRYRKDEVRYATDAAYRAGWDEGHARCYEEEQRTPHMGDRPFETLDDGR